MTDIALNGLGTTSLLLSYASKGNVRAIKELLDQGAAVNASDYDGRTALHLAACEGHLLVAELLLQRGADVNPVDRWGDTVSSPSPSFPFQFYPFPHRAAHCKNADATSVLHKFPKCKCTHDCALK